MNWRDDHSCEAVQRQLGAYAHGELGRSERVQISKHIQHCAACAQSLALQTRVESQLREGLAASVERHRPSAQVWERLQRQIAPRPRQTPMRVLFGALSTATAGLVASALLLSQAASVGLRDYLHPRTVTAVPETQGQGQAVAYTITAEVNADAPREVVRVISVNPAAQGEHGLPTIGAERIDLQMARTLLAWSPISGELNDALSTTRPCVSCVRAAPAAPVARVRLAKRTRRIVYVVYTFEDIVPKGYCSFIFGCVKPA